jgi:hypothetical protein
MYLPPFFLIGAVLPIVNVTRLFSNVGLTSFVPEILDVLGKTLAEFLLTCWLHAHADGDCVPHHSSCFPNLSTKQFTTRMTT